MMEIINNAEYPLNKTDKIKINMKTRKTAKQNGEKFYFTGLICSKGHTSKRYTHSKACFECVKLINSKRDKIRHRKTKRKWWLKNTYGLTEDQYKLMLENQNYKCKICTEKLNVDKKTHVDHSKETGKVRGILCHGCNIGIGHLKHDIKILKAAILYCEAT